jgi:hypothetical protein
MKKARRKEKSYLHPKIIPEIPVVKVDTPTNTIT